MIDFSRYIEASWYKKSFLLLLLYPLSLLTFLYTRSRRKKKLQKKDNPVAPLCPLIVVGNVTVGGTGKTPLLMAIAKYLQCKGLKVGVVSRGYGGNSEIHPLSVNDDSNADECGDEPLLIFQRLDLPVVVDRKRNLAFSYLVDNFDCDVVLSDDGMQHYELPRNLEIVVIDGRRGFGNGLLMPAGPLREPLSVLAETDMIVVNKCLSSNALPEISGYGRKTFEMDVAPCHWVKLDTGERLAFENLKEKLPLTVFAVAGIGSPDRFFDTVKSAGITCIEKVFPDHHRYSATDLAFSEKESVILMTEKDAVKCRMLGVKNAWYLEVDAVLAKSFWDSLDKKLVTFGLDGFDVGEKND